MIFVYRPGDGIPYFSFPFSGKLWNAIVDILERSEPGWAMRRIEGDKSYLPKGENP